MLSAIFEAGATHNTLSCARAETYLTVNYAERETTHERRK